MDHLLERCEYKSADALVAYFQLRDINSSPQAHGANDGGSRGPGRVPYVKKSREDELSLLETVSVEDCQS